MSKFWEAVKGLQSLIVVAAALLSICGFLWAKIDNLQNRLDRVDFLAVVTVCNSGKYTSDEVRQIKIDYRLGKLNIDALIVDWYEKP